MKLKNRDLSERERRLRTADARFTQEDNKLVQVVLLATVLFGVGVLAWVTLYLLDLSWTPGELNWQLKGSRFWPG